jgi:DNA-binding CsgD family transcriptional regulator
MPLDALTKRELEILAELAEGGRVPTIGKKLFISQHTVRNHLRSIFSKLGVHSQAELVSYVKQNPSVLGDEPVSSSDQAFLEETTRKTAEADLRVAACIADILQKNWNVKGLKEVLRVVLPLDEQSTQEWHNRVSLWGREFSNLVELEPHLKRLAARRERARQRIQQAQEEGWIRGDLEADEIAKGLYSVILGAALELLRRPGEQSEMQQLNVLDANIDSITDEY